MADQSETPDVVRVSASSDSIGSLYPFVLETARRVPFIPIEEWVDDRWRDVRGGRE